MLYHAIRLACITYSSYKTWAAVVDPKDKGQSRRHLFLWLVYLAGLALEPIVDSVAAHRLAAYEGIKIIITGWLLLAHYYLSKTPNVRAWSTNRQASTNQHNTHAHLEQSSSFNNATTAGLHREQSSLRLRPESRSSQGPKESLSFRPAPPGSASASSLDFGRFKRDLELRRTGSISSSVAPVPISRNPTLLREDSREQMNRDVQDRPIFSLERLSRPLATAKSASVPPTWARSDTHRSTDNQPPRTHSSLERTRSRSSFASQTPGEPLEPAEHTVSTPKPSQRRIDRVEVTNPGRKRNYSETLPEPGDTRQRAGSAPQTSRLTIQQMLRQRNRVNIRRRPTAVRENADQDLAEPMRGSKRTKLALLDERQAAAIGRVQQEEAGKRVTESRQSTQQDSLDPPHSTQLQPKLAFARPKPPGRHRASLLTHHTAPAAISSSETPLAVSTEATLLRQRTHPPNPPMHSASFESRMNNVREWVKTRNPPPLASPPLTATSHDQHKGRTPSPPDLAQSSGDKSDPQGAKRKASRQLAPSKDTKRLALMQQERGRQRSITPPTDDLERSGPKASRSHDPRRDHPPPVQDRPSLDWSKFERQNRLLSKRPLPSTSKSAPTPAVPLWKTPVKPSPHPNPFLPEEREDAVGLEPEDNPSLAPLVRLRQSQLRQRQQEDLLGIPHKEDPEDSLRFNQALELWQQEDDETLARNAAREAEVAETRRRHHILDSGDDLKQGPARERSVAGDRLLTRTVPRLVESPARKIATPRRIASTPSLLRTIPFNGDSAQRPLPDLQSRRSRLEDELEEDDGKEPAFQLHRRPPIFGRSLTGNSGGNVASPNTRKLISTTAAAAASLARSKSKSPYNTYARSPSNKLLRTKDVLSTTGVSASSSTPRREQQHPGLYTPSKTRTDPTMAAAAAVPSTPTRNNKDARRPSLPPQSPYKSTPTVMSRYVQLSYSDEEEDS
ncbi:hypothetical protein EMPS_04537 [Entomortierella parvispora]|uniref:Uncharacterized protein n=1 Tax=Entomortierella parvispora TaxID=205924 RepID=A0A9P3H8Q9_9FUNG|nr:hypothetical protein EMPS_04537 [Entomortierella parvispora]